MGRRRDDRRHLPTAEEAEAAEEVEDAAAEEEAAVGADDHGFATVFFAFVQQDLK